MPRGTVVLVGVAVAAGVALLGGHWAGKSREALTATPVPRPFNRISDLVLAPGAEACQRQVALDPAAGRALLFAGLRLRAAPRLTVSVRGGGYRARTVIPGGYPAGALLVAPLPPPPRPLLASLCVRNTGARAATLQGSSEQRLSAAPATRVDGRPVGARMTLLIVEGRDRTIASRWGAILDHVAAFRPAWVSRATLALLALLVVAGVPLLVVGALWLSGRRG